MAEPPPGAPGAGRLLLPAHHAPPVLAPLLARLADPAPADQAAAARRPGAPSGAGRPAGVLVLFGSGPDVLLIERAEGMRSHAGQPAFPGGAVDPDDDGPVGAAVREAAEETGLDPAGVQPLATLDELYLPPSGFRVTPVIAWWRVETPVAPGHPDEVAAVVRVPLADLVAPDNRWMVTHPSGWLGPAFEVAGMLVWGFTAGLLDRILELGGFAVPWDDRRRRELPEAVIALARRTRLPGGPGADVGDPPAPPRAHPGPPAERTSL